MEIETRNSWDCKDCEIDTSANPRDYYMVTCDVWNRYGLGGSVEVPGGWEHSGDPSGMLCMDCMERRLGRKLRRDDLMSALVNHINPYTRGVILNTYE